MRRFISILSSAESLLRFRWRWVLAVMTPCVCLGVYWAVQSPTWHARTEFEVEGLCPHGLLTNSPPVSGMVGGRFCPQCKLVGAK